MSCEDTKKKLGCLHNLYLPDLFKTKEDENERISCLSVSAQSLDSLRQTGQFCDLVLQCSDGEVSAHTNLIAASTSLFNVYVNQRRRECDTARQTIKLDIPDVNRSTVSEVNAMVSFLYTGKTHLNEDIVKGVYSLSKSLKLTLLTEHCVTFIRNHLNIVNVLLYMDWADTELERSVYQDCISVLVLNIQHLVDIYRDNLLKLPLSIFRRIICDKRLVLKDSYVAGGLLLGSKFYEELRRVITIYCQVNQSADKDSLLRMALSENRDRSYAGPCEELYHSSNVKPVIFNSSVAYDTDNLTDSSLVRTCAHYPPHKWMIKSILFYLTNHRDPKCIAGFDITYRNIWSGETGVHRFECQDPHNYTLLPVDLHDNEWIVSITFTGLLILSGCRILTNMGREFKVLRVEPQLSGYTEVDMNTFKRSMSLLGLQGFSYALSTDRALRIVSHINLGFATFPPGHILDDFGSVLPESAVYKLMAQDSDKPLVHKINYDTFMFDELNLVASPNDSIFNDDFSEREDDFDDEFEDEFLRAHRHIGATTRGSRTSSRTNPSQQNLATQLHNMVNEYSTVRRQLPRLAQQQRQFEREMPVAASMLQQNFESIIRDLERQSETIDAQLNRLQLLNMLEPEELEEDQDVANVEENVANVNELGDDEMEEEENEGGDEDQDVANEDQNGAYGNADEDEEDDEDNETERARLLVQREEMRRRLNDLRDRLGQLPDVSNRGNPAEAVIAEMEEAMNENDDIDLNSESSFNIDTFKLKLLSCLSDEDSGDDGSDEEEDDEDAENMEDDDSSSEEIS